ncbi:MAG: tripartite tricarboxylate transporter TctB family protein [Betaproteobacteria bacterium]
MKSLRRLNKDRVSALLLILLGLGIVAEGLSYRMGSLTRMGAGYMPVVYGTLLALVGVAIGATAEKGDFGNASTHPTQWRGWLCILGGVLAFVVLGFYGGLVPATFAAVFISAMGDKANSVLDAALLALGLVITGALIFSYGLQLQLPLFAWGH